MADAEITFCFADSLSNSVANVFYAPGRMIGGILFLSCLFVCLSVCLSVVNFNIRYNL